MQYLLSSWSLLPQEMETKPTAQKEEEKIPKDAKNLIQFEKKKKRNLKLQHFATLRGRAGPT